MDKQKIFLAHLPQWNIEQPPLGISYLAACLKKSGYPVIQKDFSIELYHALPAEKKYLLESHSHLSWLNEKDYMEKVYPVIKDVVEEWAHELAKSNAPIIGFTMLSTNWIPTLQVAKRVKEISPEKIIVVGGPYVTRYGEGLNVIKNNCIDFVVPGEGEEVLQELLSVISNSQDVSGVIGIIYKKNNQVLDTGIRPLIKNLDDLPYPSFREYPLDYYKSFIIPILGSRGCIYNCSFCSEKKFWETYRYRTGAHIFGELRQHYDTLGCRYFYIVDSLINGNMQELEILCDMIIKSGLLMSWGGKASIRKEMTGEMLNKMRKAGCIHLDYGMESAAGKVLRDMNKAHSPLLASEVIKNSYEAGIKNGLFWIIGFPTESDTDFQESMAFMKEHARFLDHVTPGYGCGIQPGSALHNDPQKYGIYWKDGEWFSAFTTPEVRNKRISTFKDFCLSLNVPTH